MSPKLLNLLLIITPVVLYFGYIDPMVTGTPGLVWTPEKSIPQLQTSNKEYIKTLSLATDLQTKVNSLTKEYKTFTDKMAENGNKDKISFLLPNSIDQIKLRNEVNAIADNSGVAIGSLKVDKDNKKQENSAMESYIVSFSIKARYPLFKKFLEQYEKSQRLFVLDSLTIIKPELKDGDLEDSDKESLQISVTSKVYIMKKQ